MPPPSATKDFLLPHVSWPQSRETALVAAKQTNSFLLSPGREGAKHQFEVFFFSWVTSTQHIKFSQKCQKQSIVYFYLLCAIWGVESGTLCIIKVARCTCSHYWFEKQEFLKENQFQTWNNAKSCHKITNPQLDILNIAFSGMNSHHTAFGSLMPSLITHSYQMCAVQR